MDKYMRPPALPCDVLVLAKPRAVSTLMLRRCRWVEGFPSGKEMGKWVVTPGKWFVDEEADKGMAVSEDMRFHSISAKMDKPSSSKGKDIVVQFSAKIENHQYAFCGGGYIKLLPDSLD